MWTISMSKVDCDGAPAAAEELRGLRESIALHGLLHPITVVKRGNEHFSRYAVVAGRKRFQACQRLGYKKIRAVVIPDDPVLIEMVEISENFHRREMTVQEREKAMVRYAELYRLKKPTQGRKDLARRATRQARRDNLAGAEAPARRGGDPEVVRDIAQQFGVSPRTAQQALRRATLFSEAELDTLRRRGLSDQEVDRLGRLEAQARKAVVGLVVEGLSLEDATAEVLAVPKSLDRERMARLEFLEGLRLYGDSAVNQPRFVADALLYRALQDARVKFLRDGQWAAKKALVGEAGPYFRRALHFLECPHPRDWIHCSHCHGGYTQAGECRACGGGGYLLG